MSINELIEKYKDLARICADTDYANKRSVKKNNSAAKEMDRIIEIIKLKFNREDIRQFAELLKVTDNKINLWVATGLLQRITLEKDIEQAALSVINEASIGETAEALGFQMWLKNWKQPS